MIVKGFVETSPPLATAVWGYVAAWRSPFVSIGFDNVPTEHLDAIHDRAFDVLNAVARDGIDLERLR